MIPPEIIEDIRSKSDIVKVVSEYVQLKKRGRNHLGLCPFHPEKDASFTVSPEKQIFHCFGCNEGGNVFAFIMKIENISFAEAVEELGEKVGVNVPKPTASPSRSAKEKLYPIMQMALSFYEQALKDSPAQTYLEQRGIKTKLFHFGFAPAGWDHLFKYLVGRGVSPEQMEKCGLVLKREGKNDYYDRFRHRLVVPVIDPRGRILAFGGRTLGNEEPKYLNSPDTPIYQKGETLFGLNLSKDHIKKQKVAVLVEGYFDLITPFEAGITNLIASLGTALTPQQCKLVARYCDTIVLAYDADTAGNIAAERSAEIMRKEGLKVKIAQLKGGKDPDEIVRQHGTTALQKILAEALPYLECRSRRVLAQKNLEDIEARAAALREVAALLCQENDPFVQKEYVKLFAPALKTDYETLLAETKRLAHYGQQASNSNLRRVTSKPNLKRAEAEKNLIVIAAQEPALLQTLKSQLGIDDYSVPEVRAVAEMLYAADLSTTPNPAHFLLENLADEKAKGFLSRALLHDHLVPSELRAGVLNDCIRVIRDERSSVKLSDLKAKMQEAEKAGNTAEAEKLLILINSEIFPKSIR